MTKWVCALLVASGLSWGCGGPRSPATGDERHAGHLEQAGGALIAGAGVDWAPYDTFDGALSPQRWTMVAGSIPPPAGTLVVDGREPYGQAYTDVLRATDVKSSQSFYRRSLAFRNVRELPGAGRCWMFGYLDDSNQNGVLVRRDQPNSDHVFITTHGGAAPVSKDLGYWPRDARYDVEYEWRGSQIVVRVQVDGAVVAEELIDASWLPTDVRARLVSYCGAAVQIDQVDDGCAGGGHACRSSNQSFSSDFENGSAGWAPFGYNAELAALSSVALEPGAPYGRAGQVLKLGVRNPPSTEYSHGVGVSYVLPGGLPVDTWWRLRFDARRVSGTRLLQINRMWGGMHAPSVVLEDGWRTYDLLIRASVYEISALVFSPVYSERQGLFSAIDAGTFLLDDVTLTPVPSCSSQAAATHSSSLACVPSPVAPGGAWAQVRFRARGESGAAWLHLAHPFGESMAVEPVALTPSFTTFERRLWLQDPGQPLVFRLADVADPPNLIRPAVGRFQVTDVQIVHDSIPATTCPDQTLDPGLLVNGSFECNAAGWMPNLLDQGTESFRNDLIRIGRVADAPPGSAVSLEVTLRGIPPESRMYTHNGFLQINLREALQPGELFKLSFDAKSVDGFSVLKFVQGELGLTSASLSREWRHYELTGRAAYPTNAFLASLTYWILPAAQLGIRAGTFRIDNVSVRRCAAGECTAGAGPETSTAIGTCSSAAPACLSGAGVFCDGAGFGVRCERDANGCMNSSPSNDCVMAVCGDGIVQSGEVCDDGNADDGDGCSRKCQRLSRIATSHSTHACGLKNGEIACWGVDTYGQLQAPPGPFIEVTSGWHFVCGLRPSGVATCWGSSWDVPNGDRPGRYVHITAGQLHLCGLAEDGSVTCWGQNHYGQGVPPAGVRFAQLDAGGWSTCGVTRDGDGRCWGWNEYGQANVPAGRFREISPGYVNACGLKFDGSVECWGPNYNGVNGVLPGTYQQVSADWFITAALHTDGRADLIGNAAPNPLPGRYLELATGATHACGLREDGRFLCWANTTIWRIAPTSINADSCPPPPAACSSGSGVRCTPDGQVESCEMSSEGCLVARTQPCPNTHACVGAFPAAGCQQIDAGDTHTCAASRTDLVVKCWGSGPDGQLGRGALTEIGDDESVGTSDFNWLQTHVSAGARHTCGVEGANFLGCFGNGGNGRTGLATTQNRSSFTHVFPWRPSKRVYAGVSHTCVLAHTGHVRCFGRGADGALGTESPADVGDDEQPASARDAVVGTGLVTELATGDNTTCALFAAGNVRCWGRAGAYAYASPRNLGADAGTMPPLDVALGARAVQISSKGGHTCAVLEGGVLRCWGENEHGQLGHTTTGTWGDEPGEAITALSPVNVGAPVVQVAAGRNHTCVVLVDGRVKCWGLNDKGQLGYGHTNTLRSPPDATVDVGGLVRRIAVGAKHTCALLADGNIRCWGQGGLLGRGDSLTIGDDETPAQALNEFVFHSNCLEAGDGLACDDGNACSRGDVCRGFLCRPGTTARVCNDGNDCTIDACEPARGCVAPPAPVGTACNDLNACTQGDACVAGAVCSGQPVSCDDGNGCTLDSCEAATGCKSVLSSTLCDFTQCEGFQPFTPPGRLVYRETFEACADAWLDAQGNEPAYAHDATWSNCSPASGGKVQRIVGSSRRYQSSWFNLVPVTPGATYCVAVSLRSEGEAKPYVSVVRYDQNKVAVGTSRLIGRSSATGDSDPHTGPIVAVAAGAAWRRHRKTLVAPADAAFLQAEVGTEGGDANAAALLDDLAVHEGACE